ncbi:Gas vesicle synthesis protein GvpO [uncultured archaeon]|nr:Gas vesicle synthesis protein GvpO [uncultured archaeon]
MTGKPKIQAISENSFVMAETLFKKKVDSIVSVSRDGEGWMVESEVLERKAVPDTQDILGKYEMKFDDVGELQGYRRIGLRHRSDMEVVEEEV